MTEASLLAATADEFERLIARLSRFSPRSVRIHRDAIDALMVVLVLCCAQQQGRTLEVPTPDDHAVADAVAVIGREAIAALVVTPDSSLLATVRTAVATALAATR